MGTAVDPGDPMRTVFAKGTRWFNCCHDLTALVNGYNQALQATRTIVSETKAGQKS